MSWKYCIAKERGLSCAAMIPKSVLALGRILLALPEPSRGASIEARAQELFGAHLLLRGVRGNIPCRRGWRYTYGCFHIFFGTPKGSRRRLKRGRLCLSSGSTDLLPRNNRLRCASCQEKQEEQGASREADIFPPAPESLRSTDARVVR